MHTTELTTNQAINAGRAALKSAIDRNGTRWATEGHVFDMALRGSARGILSSGTFCGTDYSQGLRAALATEWRDIAVLSDNEDIVDEDGQYELSIVVDELASALRANVKFMADEYGDDTDEIEEPASTEAV